MAEGPPAPDQPDPPGAVNTTAYTPVAKTRGNQRSVRLSTNGSSSAPPPPPSTPLTPSQSTVRPSVTGLAAFEAGKQRKRQATAGADKRPSRANQSYLGTPRSTRFRRLFTDDANVPGILEVTKKLYELVEGSIKLPKKGAEKTTIGSESAADIKTLAAHLLDLAETLTNIPAINRNPFADEDDDHHVARALAGANVFGCKLPDLIEKKLDKFTKDLAEIKHAVTMPTADFRFNPTSTSLRTPTYALAASKHAPRQQAPQATTQAPVTFRPVHHKKPPPPPPTAVRTTNTVTLTQTVKNGLELTAINYPTLIGLINTKLKEANVKVTPTDEKPVQIRSVHRHPSNDLVLYTTTPQQADTLRLQSHLWLHNLSTKLEIHSPVHYIVVHGIPTVFKPTDPQHVEMLVAMNPDTLNPAPTFIKWVSPNAIHRGVTHFSIRMGFTDAEQARKAVEQKIFYGRYNKKTEFGRKTKPRCMNCLKDGHTSSHCKDKMMCPYCSEAHTADSCRLKGMMTSNCTACARHKKASEPSIDLKSLFSTTPKELSHSPLDPTCPTRVAEKVARATSGSAPAQVSATTSAPPGGRAQEPGQVRPPITATNLTQTADTGTEDMSMVVNQ